jgi:excisionase family DNA binding protein
MAHIGKGRSIAPEPESGYPVTTQRLLTLLEVADLLRVSPHTVRAWVRKGRLQPVRICRRLLFSPDVVSRFVSVAEPCQ